ncbi:acetyltransferase [Puniceicoccales bacterium CK1056]|uniref:Acetyltransferase n=1 Tax=Oceanipulchritudo coccoides TaxID=2706888 RepID=A0A6B2LYB3_9BACT|nr:acetyltransferase [Oceanipulchritudo coccoides]NDV61621.1 acetyltransferase [Oceanipulchritudo coccoides]
MKQLIIIGAGGFGREVLEWAKQSPAYRREWEIAGFLDDRADCLERFSGLELPLLGNTHDYEPRKDDVFLCAIGVPQLRMEMRKRFEAKGAVFTRLIHESCVVGSRVELGTGVILCPRVVLTCDISIGANTAMNVSTAMGHDASIGTDCQISSFCDITGYVKIGNEVFLGSRASIIPGKQVGDRSVIGAGSVVVADVPEKVTVFGNPARLLSRHD